MSDDRQSAKRDAILRAATAAFRDEGYDTTSMDRIAELAGASKRTVYNHFGSKEALFRAVVAGLIDEAKALKRIEWDPGRELEDQLADFVRAKIRVATDPAWVGLVRVVLGVYIHNPDLVGETTLRAADGDDSLVHWLAAASAAGAVDVDEPVIAANVFWAMVTGGLFWPLVLGMPLTEGERALMTRELIATFLSRYRA